MIALVGELDAATVMTAPAPVGLLEACPEGSVVVIDLGNLGFCDAAGLRYLLGIQDAASAQACTTVARNPTSVVRRALDASGVIELLDVEPAEPPG